MRLRRASEASPALQAERDALAAEVARLHRAVDELRLLNEVALALGAACDLDAAIAELVHRARSAVDAEQGVLVLVGEEGPNGARTLIRTGSSTTTREAIHPGRLVVGWMHRHRRPLLLEAPQDDPRFARAEWGPSVRSVLAAPLVVGGHLSGVLTLYNKRGAPAFSPDEARLVTILAAQSAQVVERMRMADAQAATEARVTAAEAERERVMRVFGSHAGLSTLDDLLPDGQTEALQSRFGLTLQEARVALLLAGRKTEREIAEILCISTHTARHHAERVLSKLGVASRRDVFAALLPDGGGKAGGS